MEPFVFFDAIEKIDGRIVAGVCRQAVERLRENGIEYNGFGQGLISIPRRIGSASSCAPSRR